MALLVLPASPQARAAEFRLRDRCEVAAPVVTLGDVAEILAGEVQQGRQLAAIELFPSPPAGQARFVRQREIEDLLVLRGINLLGHRFSGAGQVQISRAGQAGGNGFETRPTASVARRAQRLVREAVVRYLEEHAAKDEPWNVEVPFDLPHAEAISNAGERISIRGGAAPWTGDQQFEVMVESPKGRVRCDVKAVVTLPPAVVVTLRSLPRGTVLQPGDVGLQRGLTPGENDEVFHSIDELLGQETTRAVPAGKVVERGFVRAPLLVRRGQVVTVHARSSGIRVRTTARARDDGSLGDLVAVESLLDRTTYFTRVCGIREVEVYARAVRAAETGRKEGTGLTFAKPPPGLSGKRAPSPFLRP